VAVGRHQREQHGRGAAHAGRREQGVLRPLQGHQLFLRRARGGVAVAAVLKALEPALLVGDELGGVLEGVGGGLDDGGGEGVRHPLARAGAHLAAVHRRGAHRHLRLGVGVAVLLLLKLPPLDVLGGRVGAEDCAGRLLLAAVAAAAARGGCCAAGCGAARHGPKPAAQHGRGTAGLLEIGIHKQPSVSVLVETHSPDRQHRKLGPQQR